MAQTTPSRRALVDLPVNTFGTPQSMTTSGKASMGRKRQIQEVEEPEFSRPTSRMRVSPVSSQTPPKDDRPTTGQPQPVRAEAMPVSLTAPPTLESNSTEEPVEDMGECDSQHSYKDSTRSSTIDFDPDDTMVSQQTTATELTQPLRSISQHAETLRLRLRLAHFKVQTNQTDLPLSQLRISRSEAPSPRESTPQRDDQPSLPRLLPAPVLLPTAFSARMTARPQDLSSPPCSPDHRAHRESPNGFRTPALPRQKVATALRQLSSPPGSDKKRSRRRFEEEDSLTSSAVRGKAAIGLLGLRQEREA